MQIPELVGPIHFIGIGGIGMSGIAEVLYNIGYQVQGSDQYENANVKRLREKGINIFIGHKEENLGNSEIVLVSTAIHRNNIECIAARQRKLPIVRRAEMLAELMRFRKSIAVGGTHGKTTTTSLIAALLDAGRMDPTVINGGIINAYGTNTRMGEGKWMVVEADESDGSFLKLPADVVVITNIDPEHLDYYGDFNAVRVAFRQFVENIPFYGFAVMCLDHPEVKKIIHCVEDRKIITYGQDPQADVCFSNIRMSAGHSVFDIKIRHQKDQEFLYLKDLVLPMLGRHNISNAAAAIAVANKLGISSEDVIKGFSMFEGVRRRFTLVGLWEGVYIFDDYGHHPVEIEAVLKAAREVCNGKIIVIHQPHRYSRLSNLLNEFSSCFMNADIVFIAPVYAAGEEAIEGINSEELVRNIAKHGHENVHYLSSFSFLIPKIVDIAKPGDFVIFLGAGNITQWTTSLVKGLETFTMQSVSCDI
ncbi:UDP-N-acetylmuramate--alanine ligase [Liberibacter crescens BT-1]|uniref:UDP-N-acetylmuramate--L-alanine ligase n=1 Tax=Liberibacter crescens (strain BT-1) TaxID=1215343 RepID=L0EUR3_LIBCB|nr:UDP-N-acetylmuramate--L-alanine ligase [Liberibacter crescens]AGA64702.1 UDP-N-acetylmuramate--alanine ligase [Liberibacter crescens BT-1]AMC12795.1 UDP-N-acetylmuramate--alanine ligase [Liberibacter crescens]